jgi:hypothetical protein
MIPCALVALRNAGWLEVNRRAVMYGMLIGFNRSRYLAIVVRSTTLGSCLHCLSFFRYTRSQ